MLPIGQVVLIKKFKKELKLEANALRVLKQDFKFAQSNRQPEACHLQLKVFKGRVSIRHRHLAYCMLRGKRYTQCEQRTRKGNEPNMNLVKEIIWDYTYHVKIEKETVPVAA